MKTITGTAWNNPYSAAPIQTRQARRYKTVCPMRL
jgi:hypothetical protein